MTADWVPFHRRLAKGPKKSIPRALRFVLLELSLEGRATRGIIDLPVDWDTLDAVHDLLGGDRREIRKALQIFTIPDATGAAALKIERGQLRHRLIITKWEEWAGPKSSTERSREHRDSKKIASAAPLHHATDATPTVQDSTEQDRRERETRPPERRLKSVPPPPTPDPPEAFLPDEPLPENGYALAERVWNELWQAKYRRRYEQTGGRLTGPQSEDAVLQRIGEKAIIRGNGAEAYLRHKISGYLRDHGNRGWLDEHCHPLRSIEHDWVAYGEPKEPRRMVPRREEPAEQPVSLEVMLARAEQAKVGGGGKAG